MKRLIISTITIFLISLLSYSQNNEPTYVFDYTQTQTDSSSIILQCSITKPAFQHIQSNKSINCSNENNSLQMSTTQGTSPDASFNLKFSPFAIPLTKIIVYVNEPNDNKLGASISINNGTRSEITSTFSNNVDIPKYEFILNENTRIDEIIFSLKQTESVPTTITIKKIEIYTDHKKLLVKYNESKTITGNVYYDEVIVESDQTCNTGQIVFADENSTLTTDCFKIHKFLDDKEWYFFSTPFDIDVNKIRFINTTINGIEDQGKAFTYNENYLIKYYNQKTAALGEDNDGNQSKTGWTNTKYNESLYNNFGHMIGISQGVEECKTTMVLEYNENLTLKHPNKYQYKKYENFNDQEGTPETGIQIWYDDKRVSQNDAVFDINKLKNKNWNWYDKGNDLNKAGWNFVSIPFLNSFQENSVIEIPVLGQFNPEGKDNSIENPLISIPNYTNFKTYNQMTLQEAIQKKLVKPCSPFFIQLASAAPPIYKFGNAPLEQIRKNAAQIDNSSTAEIYVTAPNNENDRTTIISEDGMTTDYEIGYDLLKLIGYADIPQLYSIQDSTILAYNTLEISNTTTIPLGIFVPQDGEYTFSLGDKSNFDVIILNDAIMGTSTDLKTNNYKTDIKRGEYKDRFSVTLRNNYLPTEGKTSKIDLNPIVHKNNDNLCIEGLPENSYIRIYDSFGTTIVSERNSNSSYNYKPLCHGVYIIIIETENETYKMKTIY